MADNTNKFTIEVKGLPLTDDQRATISKALNETLMKQIGGMDFRGKETDAEAASNPLTMGYIIDIQGGGWDRILNSTDFFKSALQSVKLTKSLSAGTIRVDTL